MAHRLLRWLGIGVTTLVMLCAGAWAALALWVRLVPWLTLGLAAGAAMALLTLAAVAALALRRQRVVMVFAVAFAVVLGWWGSLTPSNDRAWAPDVAHNAWGTVQNQRLTVHNVRNFIWRSDTDFEPRWETRVYDLSKLNAVDLFMSHWAGESIAHTILSFGFSDGQFLAFSIEIRREAHESFSAIAGFFRAYELALIAADERDVVGVRTNVRGEDVRLYRLRMAPDKARDLLLEYVALGNELQTAPRFYNTLITNCTTQIFRMVRAIRPGLPLDHRMLLAGFVPDFIYEQGGLDTRVPFPVLREKSHIQGRARSDDPDFSRLIREGVPNPRAP